jgi:hypothetical protein
MSDTIHTHGIDEGGDLLSPFQGQETHYYPSRHIRAFDLPDGDPIAEVIIQTPDRCIATRFPVSYLIDWLFDTGVEEARAIAEKWAGTARKMREQPGPSTLDQHSVKEQLLGSCSKCREANCYCKCEGGPF